jgi:4-amino-4-deoxy-L-arabinose transferase-like glycosyltransferase
MFKKSLSGKILLLLIVILAGVLRFYKLGEIPSALSWDEVAQGYNAYSILKTGRDEFGRFLPRDYLESFGDFKPVLYTYAAIIPVKIYGLNEFSTRFPSAFFGTLTVLLTYFLGTEIFYKSNSKKSLGLLSAFFLAISPWHIQMSRAAFEANLGLFWVVLGVFLIIRGLNWDRKSIILSAIPFAAVFYTFNSTRVFIPIFLAAMAFLYIRQWFKLWKYAFAAIFLFQLLLTFITPHLLSDQAKLRFREVNIFADLAPVELSNARIAVDDNTWWSKILHNRRWMYTLEFLRHYSDNLNLKFLFLHGDGNPKFSIQDVGQEYLVNLPFFIIGLFLLFKKYPNGAKIIIPWLLIGIIPAATARETPHALRILQTLPTWQIIIAIGWLEFFQWVKNKKDVIPAKAGIHLNRFRIEYGMTGIAIILLLINFFWYLHNYYAHYPKEFASEWQYGYKQALEYIKSEYQNYDKIAITDNIGRPYIYTLFYNQYSPEFFRATAVIERDAFGFVKVKGFYKYLFGNANTLKFPPGERILVVASPKDVPAGKKIKQVVNLPKGDPVLTIYEN